LRGIDRRFGGLVDALTLPAMAPGGAADLVQDIRRLPHPSRFRAGG